MPFVRKVKKHFRDQLEDCVVVEVMTMHYQDTVDGVAIHFTFLWTLKTLEGDHRVELGGRVM